MGELTYTFRRYTRMSRCLISINENYYYLILTLDFDQYDFDKIIIEKNNIYQFYKFSFYVLKLIYFNNHNKYLLLN